MSNVNQKKVHAVLVTLQAKKITVENAVDVLTRLIGRAYYNGLNATENAKTRPQEKTRAKTSSV